MAASLVYHDEGAPFHYRVRRKRNRWTMAASDGELIGHLPKAELGPWATPECAQAVCQTIDDDLADAKRAKPDDESEAA